MICEIISVGTELLLGDILNTDARFIARELAEIGISIFYQSTVGDNEERLSSLLKGALSRSDVVITTGGLGPTDDDLTKEVVCKLLEVELVSHEESIKRMEEYFRKLGREMVQSNLKQAMLPQNSIVFQNDFGTAPGCGIEKDGKIVIMLPGPPRELEPMFKNYVKPYLQKFSNQVLVSTNIHVFGMGESAMAQKVKDLLEMENPTVAPYAKDGESLLRVTASGVSEDDCREKIQPVVDEITSRLGNVVYGIDCENLQTRVVELLLKNGLKIATAESCTAGLLSKRLTEVADVSKVFECGIISYSNDIKIKVLGVPEDILKKFGAVSPENAKAMANAALNLAKSDIAVSITGIAGPGGASKEKPVGLAYVAICDRHNTWVRKVTTGKSGIENREYNRYIASSNALDMLRIYLTSYPELPNTL